MWPSVVHSPDLWLGGAFSSVHTAECVWVCETPWKNCHFSFPAHLHDNWAAVVIRRQRCSGGSAVTSGIQDDFPAWQNPPWKEQPVHANGITAPLQQCGHSQTQTLPARPNLWKISSVLMGTTDSHVFSLGDMKAVLPLRIRGSWDHFQINC